MARHPYKSKNSIRMKRNFYLNEWENEFHHIIYSEEMKEEKKYRFIYGNGWRCIHLKNRFVRIAIQSHSIFYWNFELISLISKCQYLFVFGKCRRLWWNHGNGDKFMGEYFCNINVKYTGGSRSNGCYSSF